MRAWSVLPLCALLVACRYTAPVAQSVPGAAPLFRGEWRGQVTARDRAGGPAQPVRLSALATRGDEDTYDITGELTLGNVTYNVVGIGEGDWGAAPPPRGTQQPLPLRWDLTLSREGADNIAAGDMFTAGAPNGAGDQTAVLTLYGDRADTFEGTLTRVK